MIEHLHGREKQLFEKLTDEQKQVCIEYFEMKRVEETDNYSAKNAVRVVTEKAKRGDL